MTDKARVIGSSTPEGDELRLKLLPKELGAEMENIMFGDNIAFGRKSDKFYLSLSQRHSTYLLTKNKSYKIPDSAIHLKLCHDYMELVNRFKDSEDELVVLGGLTILKLFLPYAKEISIAETTELVFGDLVFDDWDTGDFVLEREKVWSAGRTLHFRRK